MRNKIKIGLPSLHSRLHPKVMKVLNLPVQKKSTRLVYHSKELEIFFLRPWDLPQMVANHYLDAAFCGFDTTLELRLDLSIPFKFTEFQSSLAFCRKKSDHSTPTKWVVATEYPNITDKYLSSKYLNYDIIPVKGATEAYPHFGPVNAIIDIVETGNSLKGNGLFLVDVIMETYPCLVMNEIGQQKLSNKKLSEISSRIQEALDLDQIGQMS